MLPVTSAIIDGEVVACGVGGHPDFASLLTKGAKAEGVCFVAFDLLKLSGKSLTSESIEKCRVKLEALIAKAKEPRVQFFANFDDAEALLLAAETAGLEGIVSKRIGSLYRSGPARTWVKVKTKEWREANRERFKLFER